ncbi:hypothetical protein FN846DRAFT_921973 [Sphaerosporella brunnea]|uniref:Uncharacterized protein n=1 Tax=Sphaerosporella brunnea TaxID=1250544 RepID=A0A5J5EKI8_9PEZI|nr:hypothetical protein FN846DRAFT_921973 [Sphaerosporella brunnea]
MSPPSPRPSPTLLPHDLIPLLLSSDASIYPSPLTLTTLTSWIRAAPTHALSYQCPHTSALAGVVVALPLRARFFTLVSAGVIKEWEIASEMISPSEEAVGGVHIWHVERYAGWRREWGRFGDAVMEDLGLAGEARWSAMCVTEKGRGMMRRFGGREGEYKGQVVVGGVLMEREEWEGSASAGETEGEGVMIIGGGEEEVHAIAQ